MPRSTVKSIGPVKGAWFAFFGNIGAGTFRPFRPCCPFPPSCARAELTRFTNPHNIKRFEECGLPFSRSSASTILKR